MEVADGREEKEAKAERRIFKFDSRRMAFWNVAATVICWGVLSTKSEPFVSGFFYLPLVFESWGRNERVPLPHFA